MTALRLFARSFLIQSLWNYRTLLGAGLAWVLAPSLRSVAGDDDDRFRRSLRRHAAHFNAHPYLAGVAAGALARLERDGEDPAVVARFRDALRSPLGSLGDGLVWSAWLPTCLLAAGAAGLAGAPPLVAVGGFLVTYNLLHLALRWWGVRMGLAFGKNVGTPLARLELQRWTERIGVGGVLLVGFLAGLALGAGVGAWGLPALRGSLGAALLPGVVLFTAGGLRGRAAWGWTPVLIPAAVLALLLAGFLT